jgi:hypothetical protein
MSNRRRRSLRAAPAGASVWGAGDRFSSGYQALDGRHSICRPYDAVFVRSYEVVRGDSSRRSHPLHDYGRWRDGWKWAKRERKGMT